MIFFFQSIWASPSESDLSAAIELFNTHAYAKVPLPEKDQLKSILSGKVVKMVDRSNGDDEPRRALGFYYTPLPRELIWIASQDPHFVVQESTTELLMSGSKDRLRWYGHIDLPWPFSNRHWVVDVWNNHQLAQKTNGQCWEHPWKKVENGLDQIMPLIAKNAIPSLSEKDLEDAIYTPYNQGALATISFENSEQKNDGTLIIYHATTVIGGDVPESLILQLTYAGLDKFLKDLEERGKDKVTTHYTSGHQPIYSGEGTPLKPYP
ncbi:MAG: hypothetical protein CMK59_04300 [Proteobacteria bacterium]|nr:hypothetical protein [Pseudomonadota bacterium]